MANLKKYKPSTDFVVTKLEDENGEPLLNEDGSQMSITRWLPHTKEYKEVRYNQQESILGTLPEEGRAEDVKISFWQMAEMSTELLANTIKEWDITWGDEDEKPEYTPELAEEILTICDFLVPQLKGSEDKALGFT